MIQLQIWNDPVVKVGSAQRANSAFDHGAGYWREQVVYESGRYKAPTWHEKACWLSYQYQQQHLHYLASLTTCLSPVNYAFPLGLLFTQCNFTLWTGNSNYCCTHCKSPSHIMKSFYPWNSSFLRISFLSSVICHKRLLLGMRLLSKYYYKGCNYMVNNSLPVTTTQNFLPQQTTTCLGEGYDLQRAIMIYIWWTLHNSQEAVGS